jgi:hypothetical protein
MEKPFVIIWKLPEVLEREALDAERLSSVLEGALAQDLLESWLSARPETLDLEALGYLLWGLSQLTGKEFELRDVLDYEVLVVGG